MDILDDMGVSKLLAKVFFKSELILIILNYLAWPISVKLTAWKNSVYIPV